MKKKLKKLSSLLLTIMVSLSCMNYPIHAEETNTLPTKEQFATVDELKTFNTNDNDEIINPAKVYFGQNNQQWWIAGSQNNDSIVLFAASPLATGQMFESSSNDKSYSDVWNCEYPDENPSDVHANHYGSSPLRTTLQGLEKSYFSSSEQALMNNTTIYTNDTKNNSVYSTTNKLYLAYGDYYDDKYITVGKNSVNNLNNGLRIDQNYWGNSGTYWLRAPNMFASITALVAIPGRYVYSAYSVHDGNAVVPAFELNLSSVIFASAAPAASDGVLTTNDAFTLRYSTDTLGSAQVSYDKSKVNLSNVSNGTYLVVQKSNGAYAKQITTETEVKANEMGLDSFANCKVWLETTSDRMTYATLATEEQGYHVNITENDGLTVTNGNQSVAQGTEITDITVEVDSEYYLPDDYINNLESQLNGLTVTKTDKGFTIKGIPTSDVDITLPPAIKKVYGMALNGSGTFETTCIGYEPIAANEFIITNNGNVDLENINVSVTGNDAEQFELDWDKTTTIQPNGSISVKVKPNDSLKAGTYQATLSVSADNVNTVTTDLQFIVSEHDYNTVVTPPTCTEKGYTTYTCKNCSHSYVGDEVNANGHTWGEWEIVDSPTCEQSGIRKHTCLVCDTEETEKLDSNGHEWETEYTVDKEPTCTTDGSKSIHCKNCAVRKDSETISRLGHSFTNYVSDNNATCTNDGTKTAKCDRCDETDTLTDVGTMLEHEYEWKYNEDATCEKNGTETGTCKHCQTEITREKADSALGHEFKNYVSDNNATCTENGSETAKCERCDKTDTGIVEDSALGHAWGEWKVIKEATTTTTGRKERVCERCGTREVKVISMLPNESKPDSKQDKDDVKTGNQTNAGLFTSMIVMSISGVSVLVILKKRKALGHR